MVLYLLDNRIIALEEWSTEGKGKKVSQEMEGLSPDSD